jgi:hypothetical protein
LVVGHGVLFSFSAGLGRRLRAPGLWEPVVL